MAAMSILEWAERWKIPPAALRELCEASLHLDSDPDDKSGEGRVQSEVRLAAARKGIYLFRNNVGAGKMESGNFVRYGLCNDSAKLNKQVKSGDLIGWEPVKITCEMAGSTIARFTSVECKRSGWKFAGTLEELAQVSWATLVNGQGGRAIITDNPNSI